MKRIFYVLLFLTVLPLISSAQDIQWAKNYGSTGYGYDVAVDDNGNSYMVGSFDGATITFGGTTLTNANAGYGDIYVVKVNTSGTVVWAKRAGQNGSDYAYGVAVDKSGNVYVAGSYYNNAITFGATTLTNSGAADAFVVKYNSSGTVVWAKKAGGAYSETASSVAVDTSGNVLVTGYFESSSISIGSYTLTNSYLGAPEVFVAKYNSAGTAQWALASLGADFDFGEDITTDASGNCFVVGTFGSNSLSMGGNTIYNASTIGTEDIFVMKVSSAGVVTWLNSFGGPAYEGGAKITSDNTGNVFISGNFGGPTINLSTTSLANYNAGTNDIFVAKLNTSGVVQWAKQIGSLSYEYFASLDVDRFGNVFVGGFFRGPELYIGNDTLYHSVGGLYSDIFITKLNPSGNPLWAYASGGTNDDQCTGVGVDYLGNCYIQGYFSSNNMTLGAFTLNSIGNSANPYLSKICSPTSKSLTQTACASYTLNSTTYTNSGVYTQTLTNQAGCDSVITLNLTINPSPTVSNTGTTTVCSGTPINIPLTASVASTFTWIAANNANTTGESLTLQTTSSIQNTILCTNSNPHNVNYTITPTSITGSCPGAPKVYTVTVNPLPVVSFSGLKDSVCLNSSIQTLTGSPAGGTFSGSGISGTTYNPAIAGAGAHSIVYTYTNANTCTNTSTKTAYVLAIPAAPSICIVTVDTTSEYNIIIWEKTAGPTNLKLYKVYRDTANNNYALIGTVAYDSLSQFADTLRHLYPGDGNPNSSSWSYKISAVDTCDNESPMSLYHTSIHFRDLGNGNFDWSPYKIEGQSVPIAQLINHKAYRDSSNNGHWVLINTPGAASTAVTDLNYGNYPNGRWRVDAVWSNTCTVTARTAAGINTTKSNIKNKNAPNLVRGYNSFDEKIKLQPNPASQVLFIVSTLSFDKIWIFDNLGRIVLRKDSDIEKTANISFDISQLNPGIYSVKFSGIGFFVQKKLIVY